MWIRMMVLPGGASVSGLETLPVAVDVQVRRITELMGVTDTQHLPLEQARELIQAAWFELAQRDGVDAPGGLANTSAGLDPALWFFAKWGCGHCAALKYRVPVHPVCAACRLPDGPPPSPASRPPDAATADEGES